MTLDALNLKKRKNEFQENGYCFANDLYSENELMEIDLDIQCPEKGAQRWMNYGDGHIAKFPDGHKPIPVPVKRGQTLFFDGNIIHGSGPNRTSDRSRRTFIAHYVNAATEQLGRHYHPVVNMQQEVVSHIAIHQGGGPCGDDWLGAEH